MYPHHVVTKNIKFHPWNEGKEYVMKTITTYDTRYSNKHILIWI